jgi:hypothetical protein
VSVCSPFLQGAKQANGLFGQRAAFEPFPWGLGFEDKRKVKIHIEERAKRKESPGRRERSERPAIRMFVTFSLSLSFRTKIPNFFSIR